MPEDGFFLGMTLLDFASDPWHATVLGQWIWRDGGPYFRSILREPAGLV